MTITENWELDEYELRLVEKIFNKKGVIFVDRNGVLYDKNMGMCERVQSKHFDSLRIFKDEIRSTKIIVDMRKLMND